MPRQPFKVALFGTSIVDPNARLPVPEGWGIMNALMTTNVEPWPAKTSEEIIADIQNAMTALGAMPPEPMKMTVPIDCVGMTQLQLYRRGVVRKDGV